MRSYQFVLRLAVVLFSFVVFIGCCHKHPTAWNPPPIHTPPQGPGEFNVLWDEEDTNGFPASPYWEAQTARYQSTLPPLTDTAHASCVQEPYLTTAGQPGEEACTVQDTVIDTPDQFPNTLCFLYLDSKVHGHVDWTVATSAGYVSWLNFADDLDINFRLVPQAQAAPPQQDRGITTNNNSIGDGDPTRYIELEFASAEVVDHFRTPWWQGLAALIDPINLLEFNKYIHPPDPGRSPFAETVGLFGLDCEHGCRSEFHPVYAIAIQLDENSAANRWAIFLRNWGDQGFCSSLNHELNLTNQQMSLLLPWPGATGLKAEIEQLTPGAALPGAGLLQDQNGVGEGALLTFTLPKPSERGLIEAIVRFQRTGGSAVPARAGGSTQPSPQVLRAQRPDEGEQDAERMLGQLRTKAGVRKPALTLKAAAAPQRAVPPQPIKLKVNVYRRAKSAAPPVAVECGRPGSANPCPADKAKQQRDIEMWKQVCAGLSADYPDEKVRENCAKIRSLEQR